MAHPQDLELEATQHSLGTELKSPVRPTESHVLCSCPVIFTSVIHEVLYIEQIRFLLKRMQHFLKRKGWSWEMPQ